MLLRETRLTSEFENIVEALLREMAVVVSAMFSLQTHAIVETAPARLTFLCDEDCKYLARKCWDIEKSLFNFGLHQNSIIISYFIRFSWIQIFVIHCNARKWRTDLAPFAIGRKSKTLCFLERCSCFDWDAGTLIEHLFRINTISTNLFWFRLFQFTTTGQLHASTVQRGSRFESVGVAFRRQFRNLSESFDRVLCVQSEFQLLSKCSQSVRTIKKKTIWPSLLCSNLSMQNVNSPISIAFTYHCVFVLKLILTRQFVSFGKT